MATSIERLNPSKPSVTQRLTRALMNGARIIVGASAVAGAVFAYLTWTDPSPPGTHANTAELVRLAMTSLDREEDRLAVQRLMLEHLSRMLPEAEKARVGIERLIILTERRQSDVKNEREELSRRAGRSAAGRGQGTSGAEGRSNSRSSRATSTIASWWEENGPGAAKNEAVKALPGSGR